MNFIIFDNENWGFLEIVNCLGITFRLQCYAKNQNMNALHNWRMLVQINVLNLYAAAFMYGAVVLIAKITISF